MTIEALVDTLYTTIRTHVNYDSEFDLPHVEFRYHPKIGWAVFVTCDSEAVTHPKLFYKLFKSPEDGLLENIAYFKQFERK